MNENCIEENGFYSLHRAFDATKQPDVSGYFVHDQGRNWMGGCVRLHHRMAHPPNTDHNLYLLPSLCEERGVL